MTYGDRGRVTVKVLPWVSLLSTVIEPSWASTMNLAMLKPKPQPSARRDRPGGLCTAAACPAAATGPALGGTLAGQSCTGTRGTCPRTGSHGSASIVHPGIAAARYRSPAAAPAAIAVDDSDIPQAAAPGNRGGLPPCRCDFPPSCSRLPPLHFPLLSLPRLHVAPRFDHYFGQFGYILLISTSNRVWCPPIAFGLDVGAQLIVARLYRPRSPPLASFLYSQASAWCSYPRASPVPAHTP